jgi:hypothetical protein
MTSEHAVGRTIMVERRGGQGCSPPGSQEFMKEAVNGRLGFFQFWRLQIKVYEHMRTTLRGYTCFQFSGAHSPRRSVWT